MTTFANIGPNRHYLRHKSCLVRFKNATKPLQPLTCHDVTTSNSRSKLHETLVNIGLSRRHDLIWHFPGCRGERTFEPSSCLVVPFRGHRIRTFPYLSVPFRTFPYLSVPFRAKKNRTISTYLDLSRPISTLNIFFSPKAGSLHQTKLRQT